MLKGTGCKYSHNDGFHSYDKAYGLNTLLQFEPQPDSEDSSLYNFQTAEQLQQFICFQCDVITSKLQPDRSLNLNLPTAAYMLTMVTLR